MSPPRLRWTWKRFEALSLDELYDALVLRCRVFILEQGPYQDPDGLDRVSWHLLGHDEAGALQAYLRVVDPGAKFAEPSMGRVITSPEVRGTGVGRLLVAEGVRRIDEAWPGHANRISAQLHLSKFYQAFGFQEVGEPYGEDRIPHVQMIRSAAGGFPPPLMSPGPGAARTSSLTSLRGEPDHRSDGVLSRAKSETAR